VGRKVIARKHKGGLEAERGSDEGNRGADSEMGRFEAR